MADFPLVSIVCLSMNHEKYIEKSFASVVNQTYANVEIWYADNNSTDVSFEKGDLILKESGLAYQGFKREKNYGISANLNFLINKCRGKYITIISADDWWETNNLAQKIAYYEMHPQYGMLYGTGFFHDYITNETKAEELKHFKSGWVLKEVVTRNFINAIGVVIKKETFAEVGLFDERSLLEDWDMWIRIAVKKEIGFFDQPLVYYGQTGKNVSKNKLFMNQGYEYIFKKYGHYKEIEAAKKFYQLMGLYDDANEKPGLKNLSRLLANYQFTLLHFRQVIKCMLGIGGIKVYK